MCVPKRHHRNLPPLKVVRVRRGSGGGVGQSPNPRRSKSAQRIIEAAQVMSEELREDLVRARPLGGRH